MAHGDSMQKANPIVYVYLLAFPSIARPVLDECPQPPEIECLGGCRIGREAVELRGNTSRRQPFVPICGLQTAFGLFKHDPGQSIGKRQPRKRPCHPIALELVRRNGKTELDQPQIGSWVSSVYLPAAEDTLVPVAEVHAAKAVKPDQESIVWRAFTAAAPLAVA